MNHENLKFQLDDYATKRALLDAQQYQLGLKYLAIFAFGFSVAGIVLAVLV